ncbi:hypothetical protein DL93DRAFT_1857798 [Clavulina sp. PMI_390]|nr:hypothetical protein DL93DRAFT_1857798 [Clavulina sp. PMI_390]
MFRASWLFLVIFAQLVIATQIVMTPHGHHEASKVHLVPPGSNKTASQPISYINATWDVPTNPLKTNNQVLFLLNALQTSSLGGDIIEPVLQWGKSAAGGGHYWAVANWYGHGGHFFYTGLHRVKPGALNGQITRLQLVNGYTYYRSRFIGLPESGLLTVRTTQDFYFAAIGLEAYSLSSLKNFPFGWTTFSDINLLTEGIWPNMKWATYASQVDQLKIIFEPNRQGSRNAVMSIVYPN